MRVIPIPARPWLDHAAMGLLIGMAGWLSLTFSSGPGELAAVWISNGIFTGWLLSRPTRLWSSYLLVGLVADILGRAGTGNALPQAVANSFCDFIEVLIVAGTVRRLVPDVGDPKHWVSLGGIATASTLVACAASGLVAASVASRLHGSDFGAGFIGWFAAHVVGMVVFATATLVIHREGRELFSAPGRRRSFLACMLLIAAAGIGVFLAPYPVLFMAYPPLLLGAFRFRFAGVAVGVLLLAGIGSAATALGHGPLWLVDDIGMPGRIALLQLYIAGGCLMTIPVALAMAQRKRLMTRILESELRYRMLADYSHDVIVRMTPRGERLYVSPSARDILGWPPEEMLGSRWDLIHPDDLPKQAHAMAEVLATGEPRTEVYRVRHKEGHYVWIEAVVRPIPSADGKDTDIIYTGRDISRRVAAEQALEASRKELEHLARADTLTGLPNRRQFNERLALALRRLERHGGPVALMYLDVDRFKQINDAFGHAAGDQVLRSFAQRLSGCVRSTDLVARLGGDEFVVLVEDASLPHAAEAIAKKLLVEMRHRIDAVTVSLAVTTSIGIAYSSTPTDADTLLATADKALYAAKEAGRNTYRMQAVIDPRFGDELAGA